MSITWDAVSAVATLALAIGIPATLLEGRREKRIEIRQQRYEHYATRYQEIFSHLPYNIFIKGNKATVSPDQKAWLVTYIDLCNEELFDSNHGRIEPKIWEDWSGFIKGAFNCSALKEIFEEVKGDYSDFDDFLHDRKKYAIKHNYV